MNLEHLKALCEKAEQGNTSVFGDVKGFWIQSKDVLKLLSIIEIQREALEHIWKAEKWDGLDFHAHEALTAVDGILGEV